MKSAVIVCLAFCLIGLVFCQTQQGAASTGSSSNALQRAQLMQALGSRGLGRGLGRLAPYLFLSGGMDNQMMEMMMCMRIPMLCLTMMQ
jgi:preprotein translocase subunit SecG